MQTDKYAITQSGKYANTQIAKQKCKPKNKSIQTWVSNTKNLKLRREDSNSKHNAANEKIRP